MIPVSVTPVELADWVQSAIERQKKGLRYAHLTVRRSAAGRRRLEALFLDRRKGSGEILAAPLPDGLMSVPSITSVIPAAHWAERLVGDLWGIRFEGHIDWKSLILNREWPEDAFPLHLESDGETAKRDSRFMVVQGDGVHEIPVGPIHAGVIEPGHFRFSCLGEVIANLEIRLGWLHRGIEQNMVRLPWRKMRFLAENAASDMAVAGGLAHALAIEGMLGVTPPPRAQALRTLALEIERIANHLGDLGALASDVGFAVANATFARLRGDALGLGQKIGGSRYQTGLVKPGGVSWDFEESKLQAFIETLGILIRDTQEINELFFENTGVQDRFEGVGVLTKAMAEEFGMVGPAARASGLTYDARKAYRSSSFEEQGVATENETAGDVWARAKVRRHELDASLKVIADLIKGLPEGPTEIELPDALPANAIGIGIVESWRGELIHWISTDSDGRIDRYVIRDPSFQNWTGLAIAIRQNLVADFPIVNKSFNLSYSGSDL